MEDMDKLSRLFPGISEASRVAGQTRRAMGGLTAAVAKGEAGLGFGEWLKKFKGVGKPLKGGEFSPWKGTVRKSGLSKISEFVQNNILDDIKSGRVGAAKSPLDALHQEATKVVKGNSLNAEKSILDYGKKSQKLFRIKRGLPPLPFKKILSAVK